MADTITIKANKAVAGGPPIGVITEVEAGLAQLMIDQGHAVDVSELVERMEMTPAQVYAARDAEDLRKDLRERKLSELGTKADLVRRLLEADKRPPKKDPVKKPDLSSTSTTITADDGPRNLP